MYSQFSYFILSDFTAREIGNESAMVIFKRILVLDQLIMQMRLPLLTNQRVAPCLPNVHLRIRFQTRRLDYYITGHIAVYFAYLDQYLSVDYPM